MILTLLSKTFLYLFERHRNRHSFCAVVHLNKCSEHPRMDQDWSQEHTTQPTSSTEMAGTKELESSPAASQICIRRKSEAEGSYQTQALQYEMWICKCQDKCLPALQNFQNVHHNQRGLQHSLTALIIWPEAFMVKFKLQWCLLKQTMLCWQHWQGRTLLTNACNHERAKVCFFSIRSHTRGFRRQSDKKKSQSEGQAANLAASHNGT